MAHRVRGFLRSTPVLLLTATPMQNSLAELWGLVQYVEPTGTLLGDIATFREVFCAEDDRTLVPGQEHELQRRLAMVLQRTLRRQAQEFLDRPFTQRRCRLYEYAMSDDERSLYDDVTEYLLAAVAVCLRRSTTAAAADRVSPAHGVVDSRAGGESGERRRPAAPPASGIALPATLGSTCSGILRTRTRSRRRHSRGAGTSPSIAKPSPPSWLASRVSSPARDRLPHDAKARSFQDAIKVILDLGRDGRGSGKAVVFTESITTQEYLRKLLLDIGLGDEDITLFRGVNDHERAQQAYARWQEEEGARFAPGVRPSREVAVRLALVHEFRTRSKVLVCTEAGAKGLEPAVLRDGHQLRSAVEPAAHRAAHRALPPVQPAARCHRGQLHRAGQRSASADVRDPEPEAGSVRQSPRRLRHRPARAADGRARDCWCRRCRSNSRAISATSTAARARSTRSRARSPRCATRLRSDRDAYEKEYERTSQIIESRFDENVRRVFKRLREELPDGLADLDRDLADLVDGYLAARGVEYRRSDEAGRVVFDVAPESALPVEVGDGRRFATGDARGSDRRRVVESRASAGSRAIADARAWPGGSVDAAACRQIAPPDLAALAGKSGVLCVVLVDYAGFEPVQRLVAAAVVDGAPIDPSLAAQDRALDRRPTVRSLEVSDGSRNGSTTRSTRPCSSTSARSRRASRSTSSRPSVSLSDSSRTKSWCAAASGRASPKSCGPRGSDVTRLSVPLPEIGSRRRSTGWPPGTRVSNAASARWNPGKTRSTENGETNTTSFGTGRRR